MYVIRSYYAAVSTSLESWTSRPFLTSSEVYFDLAEAALRGWSGTGDAKDNYEKAVTASFTQWGAAGVDAYLADNTNAPIDFVDYFYEGITYRITSYNVCYTKLLRANGQADTALHPSLPERTAASSVYC